MTQNIYDEGTFFDEYSTMRRSVEGLEGAPEWPSLRAMLPELQGRSVVDLGCGYGWFCRWAKANGAAEVLGIDVSERMLTRARSFHGNDGIVYRRADLETVDLPQASFDLAFSSLALHYLQDLPGFLSRVHGALKPGSNFVFSTEHPILLAPLQPKWVEEGGHRSWAIDSYSVEGPRMVRWLKHDVLKHHRTLATTVNALLTAGFTLSQVNEWAPDDAQIRRWPELAELRERPVFVLFAVQRNG